MTEAGYASVIRFYSFCFSSPLCALYFSLYAFKKYTFPFVLLKIRLRSCAPENRDGPEESGPLHFKIPRYENKRNNDNTRC